ncbi:MAG: BON domain-containing protein [Deltaproteobacteria bacterium]|nr:BON domain-containing protein [Deltaproteobacteria bacterium]
MKKRHIVPVLFLLLAGLIACSTVPPAAQRPIADPAQDRRIVTTIFKLLLDDELTRDLCLNPRCYNGHACLVGEYEEEAQKTRAIEIARNVEGVRSLDTFLLPARENGPDGAAEDMRISSEVKELLKKEENIAWPFFDVISVQGTVVLVGIVRSEEAAEHATGLARDITGVQQVISFLQTIQ